MKSLIKYLVVFALLAGFVFVSSCNEDDNNDTVAVDDRLFRPVLNEDLYSEANTIIVDLANMKRASSYLLEVSRDSFANVEFSIETSKNFVIIDENTVGEPLFYNTLYQVRATARSSGGASDSKIADFGSVRTQRFPTILLEPKAFDVTDVAALVSWTTAGASVTSVKVFAADDLQLRTPLFAEQSVSQEERDQEFVIVEGLEPETEYQIAIYSDGDLRGWINYTTRVADIDPSDPNVIDIRDNESPSAVEDAVLAAADGNIILVKRGVTYDLPSSNLTKSITIRAAYGFGEQKATLYTTGNWNIEDGSNIDHIRFVDIELRGEDYTGDYVLNPNRNNVYVGEILFDNCKIVSFRGIARIRGTLELANYRIRNSVIDSIGGYGILTTDTNPSDPPTARVNNIELTNSSFNYINIGIQSRNNSQSINIDGCTFANFIATGGRFLRYRGGDGNNNVANGISITNSIFGHSWDESGEDNYGINGIEGLESTNFNIVNNYSTQNFSFSGGEIPGFPVGNYLGTQDDLWVDANNSNFNFQDTRFSGRFDSGDPRWRVQL